MQTNNEQQYQSLDGSSQKGSPYPENLKLVDNRKFGAVIIAIALIVAGVSLFFRFSDAKKGESFEHVDGVVNSVQVRKEKIGRKEHKTNVVSVLYVPEGYDMNYFIDGSSFMLDFVRKGDVVRVYYEKGDPHNAYIAEKDWLTGSYVHTGKGYNVPLIIAAVIILIGILFFVDGVETAKKVKQQGYDPRSELELDPGTGKYYDPNMHEIARSFNHRRSWYGFWGAGSFFFTIFAGAAVGSVIQYFTQEPKNPQLLIIALIAYLIGSGMLILVMVTLIKQGKRKRKFVLAFMADDITARYKDREKAARVLWKHVSHYMVKETLFSRFKYDYSRYWLKKYENELVKFL